MLFRSPIILAINMADRMKPRGITIDIPALEAALHTRIALVSTRQKTGIEELKELIINYKKLSLETLVDIVRIDPPFFSSLKEKFPNEELGKLWMVISQNFEVVGALRKMEIQKENIKTEAEIKRMQQQETILRYQVINNALKDTYKVTAVGTRALLVPFYLTTKFTSLSGTAIVLTTFTSCMREATLGSSKITKIGRASCRERV